jgi:hypothetical protein
VEDHRIIKLVTKYKLHGRKGRNGAEKSVGDNRFLNLICEEVEEDTFKFLGLSRNFCLNWSPVLAQGLYIVAIRSWPQINPVWQQA